MHRLIYACLWFVFISPLLAGTSFAQTIVFRVINGASQKPLGNLDVYVKGISGTVAGEEEERRSLSVKPFKPDLRAVTDRNGEIRFELPNPAPPYFYVRAKVTESEWDCDCTVRVRANELTQKGSVIDTPHMTSGAGDQNIPAPQPKQDEILLILHPTPWWVRILWPLLQR